MNPSILESCLLVKLNKEETSAASGGTRVLRIKEPLDTLLYWRDVCPSTLDYCNSEILLIVVVCSFVFLVRLDIGLESILFAIGGNSLKTN